MGPLLTGETVLTGTVRPGMVFRNALKAAHKQVFRLSWGSGGNAEQDR